MIFDKEHQETLGYEAVCCNKPMFNMGLWPTEAFGGKWSESNSDGSKSIEFDGPVTVLANRYHCKACNRYIGICWHQDAQP